MVIAVLFIPKTFISLESWGKKVSWAFAVQYITAVW